MYPTNFYEMCDPDISVWLSACSVRLPTYQLMSIYRAAYLPTYLHKTNGSYFILLLRLMIQKTNMI